MNPSQYARFRTAIGILFILGLSLLIRVWSPTLFQIPGNDVPLHIAYPLHLNQALAERGLRGLIGGTLNFNHGYSQILSLYGLYQTAFTLFSLPVTPFTLSFIHSLIGMASLLAVFLFLKCVIPPAEAFWVTILISLMPIHVGMSGANAGYQVFRMTGIFLSLWRLQIWCSAPSPSNRFFYAATLLFTIGSCSDFFIPLGINLIAASWLRKTPAGYAASRQRLWTHGWVVLLCWLPCLILVGWYFYTQYLGETGGVLYRATTVMASGAIPSFTPLLTGFNLLTAAGPLALLSPFGAVMAMRSKHALWAQIIALLWGFEFIVISLSGRAIWTAHILNLATPAIILSYFAIRKYSWARPCLILGGALTLLMTGLVIFRIGNFPIRTTYGSRCIQDPGIEALGQVIRSKMISATQEPGSKKLNLAVDFEGAWFYLGADTQGHDFVLNDRTKEQPCLYVVRPGIPSAFNEAIASRIRGNTPTLEIVDGNRVLMQVFSIPATVSLGRFSNQPLRAAFWKSHNQVSDFSFSFLP